MAQAGRRAASRVRVEIELRAITLGGTVKATLLDLSTTGARITQPDGLSVGADAVLMWEGFEAFGTVAWTEGGQCGMTFDEPIADHVVSATRLADDAGPDGDFRLAAEAWANGQMR